MAREGTQRDHLDQGAGASPGPLTFHVLSGSVVFRTGDRAETLRSGELVVLELAIRHEVEALEESACLLTLGPAP